MFVLVLFVNQLWADTDKEKIKLPEMSIPECKSPPRIDGLLNDKCWEKAAFVNTFNVVGEGRTVKKHKAHVTRDDKWLYVGFDVSLPKADRLPAKYFKHDELVQREDNVQVSFDPGTEGSLYYQFLVNKANTRADFRMTKEKGRERDNFNIPWRSAARESAKGWVCEIALPFCLMLEHGDLKKAKFNLIVTSFVPIRDEKNVITSRPREKTSWAPLLNSFHEPERFGKLKDMKKATYKAPFLPFLEKAKISNYYIKEGKYHYNVSAQMQSLTGKHGKVKITVKDRPSDGKVSKVEKVLEVKGNSSEEITVPVPVRTLLKRTAVLSMENPKTGEIFQSILIDEIKSLELFSAYLDRNYYTTEKDAVAVCSIGLPAAGLKDMMLLAKNKGGKTLAKNKTIKPETAFRVPIENFVPGIHNIDIQLCRKDGGVATSQVLELLKRKPKPGCEWKIDRVNCWLLNNGKPFFPFGVVAMVYPTRPGGAAAFKDITNAGFNSIIQWTYRSTPDQPLYMKAVQDHGLYVIAGPDLCFSRYNDETKLKDPNNLLGGEDKLKSANKLIESRRGSLVSLKGMLYSREPFVKLTPENRTLLFDEYYTNNEPYYLKAIEDSENFSSLIGYNIFDEPIIGPINQHIVGRKFYKKIHETDGYHPVFVLYSGEIAEIPGAVDWSDCLGSDPYWIPAGDHRNTPNYVSKVVARTKRRADEVRSVLWTVPMAEYYAHMYKRVLTPQEQFCQTYLALIHGTKGIFYYHYPFQTQALYDAIKKLARHMKKLGPVCLQPDIKQQVTYTPGELDPEHEKYTDIQVSLNKNPEGGYVLLAANSRYYPVDATYEISLLGKKGKIRRLFSRKTYKVKDGTFSDKLEGYEVRAYAFKTKIPLNESVNIHVKMTPHPELAEKEVAYPWTGRVGMKNIFANPSFEEVTVPGWPDYYMCAGRVNSQERIGTGPKASFDVVKDNPYHGKHCLKINTGPEKKTRNLYCTVVTMNDQPGEYVFSFYARANYDDAILMSKSRGKEIIFKVSKEWKRFFVTKSVPKGKAGNRFQIILSGRRNQENTVVWIDAVQFERGDVATEFEP